MHKGDQGLMDPQPARLVNYLALSIDTPAFFPEAGFLDLYVALISTGAAELSVGALHASDER